MSGGFTGPITFAPIFHERIWGGHRLAKLYAKPLPAGVSVGESWELVDRDEAQSTAAQGTLNELWCRHREAVFGEKGRRSRSDRFPLLVKLIDATQTLSVQVHPPGEVAAELGGEPKDELWFVTAATPDACLYAGLRAGVDRERFEARLRSGADVSELLHRLPVRAGDALFVPSGRVHAIGGGCVILEIQQSSDTTYRVFDFNRPGPDGRLRELHLQESLRCIDFADQEPGLAPLGTGRALSTPTFAVERLRIRGEAAAAEPGEGAVIAVLAGTVACGDHRFGPGQLFLAPAVAALALRAVDAEVVRVTLPDS